MALVWNGIFKKKKKKDVSYKTETLLQTTRVCQQFKKRSEGDSSTNAQSRSEASNTVSWFKLLNTQYNISKNIRFI